MRSAVLVGILLVVGSPTALAQTKAPEETTPNTVRGWLEREHRFLRRYLAVVRQAAHDYSYGYKTPALLMPVTMDLFTGYGAPLHEAEERILYPALRQHMSPTEQRALQLVEGDQQEESGTVKQWQADLKQQAQGQKSLAEVADTIDFLGRMVNRHLVLQEERVFPFLDLLTGEEQQAALRAIASLEHERFGNPGRQRYEELLTRMEQDIKELGGRIW